MDDSARDRDSFLEALGRLGPPLLRALAGLDHCQRQLHPPELPRLREGMQGVIGDLVAARNAFGEVAEPEGLESFREQLDIAVSLALQAVERFADGSPGPDGVARVLESMSLHAQAQEALYPLRRVLPPVSRYFLEPELHSRLETLDPEEPASRVGLHVAHNGRDERGGFSLYVPESYDGSHALPLIVCLHGGSGHGADFMWTWLREARGRGCLLLSPTARGPTWSLNGPDLDAAPLRSMVAYVSEHWRIDAERVLLTGLSDGATYTLLCGLQPDMPFTALAPLSGVLHPANFANGNMERARGRRIYLVHGALDWMFPVQLAQMARDELEKAGAELVYREIADLSHTYAREENPRILEWFARAD